MPAAQQTKALPAGTSLRETAPSTAAIMLALAGGTALALLAGTDMAARSGMLPILELSAEWIGDVYLTLVQFLTLPLIFLALARATTMLAQRHQLGRTIGHAILFAAGTSLLGIFIALSATHLFRPGEAVLGDTADGLIRMGSHATRDIAERLPIAGGLASTMLAIVSETLSFIGSGRLYLPIMALGVATGLILAGRAKEGGGPLISARLESLYRVLLALTGRILRFSPIPIGCLIYQLLATDSLAPAAALFPYVGVLMLAFVLQLMVVYFAAVWILAGIRPLRFFRAIREAMLVAFGTSSSSASLAVALRLAHDRLGIPEPIGRLVLGAGTCLNQSGSAMFLGATVIFLAQFFGITLSLWQHGVVILSCSIAAMGTVGVPGASITVIAITLKLIGVPVETISLILGVDRLMDMCRSMLNITGDMAMAAVLSARDPAANPAAGTGAR